MAPVIISVSTPQLFGGVHLAILVVTMLLSVLAVWGIRRIRGTSAEVTTTRVAGWILLLVTLAWMGWRMLPANWNINESLPLHYSDILRFITAAALIWRPRWAVAISYYWGLTLNTQAILTPHSSQLIGPSANFFLYWGLHIAVLVAPLVLIWGVGYRPRWRDFSIAYGAALAWAALVMPINALLGTNYAFLNDLPDDPSLLDVLGPWPLYVFWQVVLVGVVWALMTWPWTRKQPAAELT